MRFSIGLFILLWAMPALAAETCIPKADAAALSMRVVQSELMVAALSCDAAGRYNAFVNKFRRDLVASNKRVLQFFQSRYGAKGTQRGHDFITRSANESSERSLQGIDQFCAAALGVYDRAEGLDQRQLARLVQDHPAARAIGFETCQEPVAKSLRQAKVKKADPA